MFHLKSKCVFILFVLFWVQAAAVGEVNISSDNFTFTYNMALRCKEHQCLHGYSYETFYKLDAEARKPQTPGAVFEMHLAILASSNGHILLSTLPFPDPNDPVYEIVVGGGGNKFTELRRNLRRNAKTSAKTTGILSAVDFRAFYIRISEDGLIDFGKEGSQVSILSYYDVNPLPINYFSFAAWNGVEAKFLYDCPDPVAATTETSPDSTAVERKLSNSESLKRTLLVGRSSYLPPEGSSVVVKIGIKITNIKYNAVDSKLSLGLAIISSWTDNRMAWEPKKFNNTTSLTFRQGQIWRPTFFNFNSEDISILDSKNPELISMASSGEATFHFRTVVNTWCHTGTGQQKNKNTWPHDEYSCTILIGAWEPHEMITLEALNTTDPKMMLFAGMDDVIQSEWEKTIKVVIVSNDIWSIVFGDSDNTTHQSDRLLISIQMRRTATTYNIVFYTPLLVLVTFVLMSFWTEPLQLSRIWFFAGCVIVICMGLCYVDYLVPSHNVPSLLILYTTILMGILLALLIHVALMTDTAQKLCKTASVQSVLTAKWFRTLFCLPTMKTCKIYESINEGYASQDDDEPAFVSPPNSTIEEMQCDVIKYGEPQELAEVVDKTMFVIYSVTFAIMLALHF
ncbi:uncharacterized protein LOC113227440 [Hyposmocoma kahamanoa]|uniref:uncharacterized protein LOC113227440 n=1 Tax=Hyposmocoma kahamanoa TaxID=1477025 RepID=UPI000E6D69D6|nr:uncharacterized protein LOC113227440 [Hyposmocoma kahamanoa]